VSGFLILVLILAAAWLLFIVPARRRRHSHQAMQDSVDIGDEIITAGGLHGLVREIGDDTVKIEISPGVVATLDRRAVAAVAREVEVEVEVEPAEDHLEPPREDPENGADTSKRANESPAEPG
jgi:preprotein translocase subunit YajC